MKHRFEIDGVNLTLGKREVLASVYLRVESGEVVAIVGSNGSGKTSLMNVIFGTLRYYGGNRLIDGASMKRDTIYASVMQFATQDSYIPRHFRVRRVFDDYGVDFISFSRTFTDIQVSADSRIGSLSKGERKLIEAYIVLKSDAYFCMLDEPFTYLSPKHADMLVALMCQARDNGKGIIVTDHQHRYLLPMADRVYLFENGYMRERQKSDISEWKSMLIENK